MNIKEVEEITGMQRANIRYYESEGLVVPQRNKENGYRIYSEEDAEALQKIRLLRTLDIPLEEIKQLRSGQRELRQVLEGHLEALQEKQTLLERSGDVSRLILTDAASFDTLDALRYLRILENGDSDALKQDVQPKLNLPWRRLWARDLDYMLCSLLVTAVLKGLPRWSFLSFPVTMLALLLTEPLLLHLFGTTPGKAVFGIRVLDPEEGKLRYGDALVRTWTVLWEGEAMRIPFVNYYFLYKAYSAVEEDQILPWEWDSELTFKDSKNWRYILYFALVAAVFACNYWMIQ